MSQKFFISLQTDVNVGCYAKGSSIELCRFLCRGLRHHIRKQRVRPRIFYP